MKATDINNIVIHCSAGFGNLASMQAFWQKTLGWKTPGYHIFIETSGAKHYLLPFDKPSNGVAGYNSGIINICYQGGVEKAGKDKNGQVIWKGKDTRTDAQKKAIKECIAEVKQYLKDNGKDVSKNLGVVGHRDFSPDKDGNGVIASWERIKECPSCNVLGEYAEFASPDRRNLLPTTKTLSTAITNPAFTKIHVVVSGDALGKIAKAYNTTVDKIKALNGLKTDVILLKQKLKIA